MQCAGVLASPAEDAHTPALGELDSENTITNASVMLVIIAPRRYPPMSLAGEHVMAETTTGVLVAGYQQIDVAA